MRALVLGFDRPRGSSSNRAFACPATVSETLIRPGGPYASINDAVFTASPQISKVKRRLPITPEMTRAGVNADPQFQRRQSQFLVVPRFHPRDGRLHLQRRKAGVDRMPATVSGTPPTAM